MVLIMKEEDIYKLLKFIVQRLEGIDLDWRLDGSVNLLVQGIDLQPNDLDIATNDKGLEVFSSQFDEFISEEKLGMKFQGRSLLLEINGLEVEINSYEDDDLRKLNRIEYLSWKDLILPVLHLKEAEKFYKKIEREKKVKMIVDKLKINREKDE